MKLRNPYRLYRVWRRLRQRRMKMEKRRRTEFRWRPFFYGLFATLLVLVLQVYDPAGLRSINEAAYDQYQRLKPRQIDPSVPVAVIDIDVRSLQALGQWPWPRTEMAALTLRLTELGALSIAYDVVFAEPDRTSPVRVVESWRKFDPDAEVTLSAELRDHDAVFGAAIAETPTVLGVVLNNDPDGSRPPVRAGISWSGSDPRPVIPAFASANVNLPLLSHSASGVGNFSLGNERADVIRRVPLLTRVEEQIVPTLALEAIRVGFQAGSILVKSNDASQEYGAVGVGIASMRVGPMEIPVEQDGGLYIYYSGDSSVRADRVVSAADILAGDQVDPALAARIAGKVVFIGTSAPGLLDLVATPFEKAAAGVNVHAELAEQIIARYFQTDRAAYRDELMAALPGLTGEDKAVAETKIGDLNTQIARLSEPVFISQPDWGEGVERLFILLIGAVASLLLAYNRTALAGAAAGLGAVVVVAACWFAFDLSGFLLGPVYPALGVFVPWGSLTIYNYVRADRDKRAVKNQFAHFMSQDVIDEISEDPDRYLTPGGDLRPLSIMFCDVRQFSTITEKMSPQETILFINEFLTPLSEVVIRNSGTIDKYMGDCIMAFWNAPRKSQMHMEQATLALFQFRQALIEINRKFVSIGFPEIDIGVGVNTGPCAVGAMGSKSRLDYSCIGDAVNLASRLEGITKQYGLWNCIGDNTAKGVGHSFALIQIDQVAVKGRSRPETIWTVAGEADTLSNPDYLALKAAVDEGLIAYKAKDWDRSEAAYRRAAEIELEALSPKGLAEIFIERITEYRAAPPPEDWNGVYVATSK
ncbi:MAG: adenylate/guanylate cyclase domain-containing protein [Paracoccaceae bacterium]